MIYKSYTANLSRNNELIGSVQTTIYKWQTVREAVELMQEFRDNRAMGSALVDFRRIE